MFLQMGEGRLTLEVNQTCKIPGQEGNQNSERNIFPWVYYVELVLNASRWLWEVGVDVKVKELSEVGVRSVFEISRMG